MKIFKRAPKKRLAASAPPSLRLRSIALLLGARIVPVQRALCSHRVLRRRRQPLPERQSAKVVENRNLPRLDGFFGFFGRGKTSKWKRTC